MNYTAFLYFLKGTTLIYAGQEFENDNRPSLFEKEPIDRASGRDLSGLMRRLYEIKQDFGSEDYFSASADDEHDIAVLERGGNGRRFIGVFSLRGESADVSVGVPYGRYKSLIDGSPVNIRYGKLRCSGEPVIIEVKE